MWRELESSRDRNAPEEGNVESRARFLVDASFPPRGVELLRSAGAQVWTSADCGLLGQTDAAHAAYALAHERVLLTCNPDFSICSDFRCNAARPSSCFISAADR